MSRHPQINAESADLGMMAIELVTNVIIQTHRSPTITADGIINLRRCHNATFSSGNSSRLHNQITEGTATL